VRRFDQLLKQSLSLPDNMDVGVFFVGETSYHYDNQPMLQQLNWKTRNSIG
jgi:nicotinate-nucleotide--dimethylbenzimidazole phosphoribosyltransferase